MVWPKRGSGEPTTKGSRNQGGKKGSDWDAEQSKSNFILVREVQLENNIVSKAERSKYIKGNPARRIHLPSVRVCLHDAKTSTAVIPPPKNAARKRQRPSRGEENRRGLHGSLLIRRR